MRVSFLACSSFIKVVLNLCCAPAIKNPNTAKRTAGVFFSMAADFLRNLRNKRGMSNTPHHGISPLLAAGFVKSCGQFPHRPAIHICGELFTYAQLLEKTEIVFAQLSSIKIPELVGIYTKESIWTYATLLAVSLSGACYVPLNPKFPEARLREIILECELQLVITENKSSEQPGMQTLV